MIRSDRPSTPLRSALAAALLACMGQAAGAAEIAPYFHAWDGSLMDARQASGLNSAILAFAISRNGCALESSLTDKIPDMRAFTQAGGKLMISFGGTAGVYVETACNDDQLFALMEKLMLDSGVRRFDFDIEGHHIQDTATNQRRARVLARLQAKYPDLQVIMSLPGWLYGFSADGMTVLNITQAAGVRIDTVIVMAQSFGIDNIRYMVSPSTVAQAAIMTFRAAAAQIKPLFPGRSDAQLHAMMGITPMIGTNDDFATFTLTDARTIANFVSQNGIGVLSWWSFQRDRAQSNDGYSDLNRFSGVAQSDFQFFNIFKAAEGPVAGTPPPPAPAPASAPAPTPAPTPAPAPASSAAACTFPAWVQGRTYPVGSIVLYEGKLYIANYWNPGYRPTGNAWDWSLYNCTGSTPQPPAPPPAPAPAPAPAPGPVAGSSDGKICGFPKWVQGRTYPAGSMVMYTDGKRYVANYWNPGYVPTGNAWDWSVHTDPTWVSGRQYSPGNIVTYSDGRLFIARAANPGTNPTTSSNYWAPYYAC